ncbi:Mitochondrial dicarboxylate transporter [Wickerhamomyces ciferrii]|uniref:Mitochondrial dicarboxylate transporter n=1 Tax=Wickerhamomyces ciferrii (strain ATCC 14091 / BCRC 22168 / CBS 111 / JCM 3599 / NBRC 0793 / NRRL Y-1031 F-60-10) TaxID=1206466 RepID=K0KJ71_WICCF|nr:Mitochondrial dicarboxylate transporter [Wickerhamomyces ciferrii]CCH42182.1 Mitochondrial dicarboxylate transporter [Wickerhamomyces ciferrii]
MSKIVQIQNQQTQQELKDPQNSIIPLKSDLAKVQNQKINKKWPFWYGGFGGAIACICTHPLDLAKVRLQTASIPKPSLFQMALSIWKLDGFQGVYSGLSAGLLRQATYSLTRFGVYEYLKENYVPSDKQSSMAYLLPISMISGGVGGIVGNPADIVNIRMQNDTGLPLDKRRNYSHALDGVVRVIREEGLQSLFRGLGTNLVRGVLMTSSQVVTYDLSKNLLIDSIKMDKDSKLTFFTASLMAGLVATTICSPADVLKTRIMNSSGSGEGVLKILGNAFKNEGPSFMFRGWVPSFVRLGPNTIITFLVVEQLRKFEVGL